MQDDQKKKLKEDAKVLRDISSLVEREFGRSVLANILDGISADIMDAAEEKAWERG